MNEPLALHSHELAYVLSYMKAGPVIGWPPDAFRPEAGKEDAYYGRGRDALLAQGLVRPGKQKGRYRFDDRLVAAAAVLANPQVVVMAQARVGDGARVLTCHATGAGVVEMIHHEDGRYRLMERPSLAAAAGAAAAFVGTDAAAPAAPVRLEANQKVFNRVKELTRGGSAATVRPALVKLGATPAQADALVEAIARPARAGLVSVFYCAANRVSDAEVYSVFTAAQGGSWVVFPPADAAGPVVLEATGLAALSARILVAITTRLILPF